MAETLDSDFTVRCKAVLSNLGAEFAVVLAMPQAR